MSDIKELILQENYDFSLTVNTESGVFLGDLKLTPSKITLVIKGEEHGDERQFDGNKNRKIDFLTCKSFNKHMILLNLDMTTGTWKSLDRSVGAFEVEFDVQFVIYSSNFVSHGSEFYYINVFSDKINQWIGNTTTQYKINKYYGGNCKADNKPELSEFNQKIENIGFIGVGYLVENYFSNLSSGVILSPSVFLGLLERSSAISIVNSYHDVYAILYFLFGFDLAPEKILFSYEGWNNSVNKASLYYVNGNKNSLKERIDRILFPLGKSLSSDQMDLPELPTELFNNFFNLSERNKGYFKKYIKYRNMQNVEDRFLGYFRLLESLCYVKQCYLDKDILKEVLKISRGYLVKKFGDPENVKAFLKRIPSTNESKYNTARNIANFFDRLPVELTDQWQYTKKDIDGICKLRNDITHANDCYIDESEMQSKTAFIEVLLVMALSENIGIPLSIASNFISRLYSYLWVIRND